MQRFAVLIAALGVALVLIWKAPHWQAARSRAVLDAQDLLAVENELRVTLLITLGAVLTVGTLIELARRVASNERATRASLALARDAQHGERLGQAVSQLGDERLEIRLAAIYALEQLASESSAHHRTIAEVLCAYVRDRAPWTAGRPAPPAVATDIQAALTVLGRRSPRAEQLDLRRTDLRGADLNGGHFEGAVLREAHLEHASLQRAHLARADLRGADLRGADLVEADLHGADLREANLEAAYLVEAHLEAADLGGASLGGAALGGAHLQGADLGGADLSGAHLYQARLDGAALDDAREVSAVGFYRATLDRMRGVAASPPDEGTLRSVSEMPTTLRRRRKRQKAAPA